jgi:hypothetical protein
MKMSTSQHDISINDVIHIAKATKRVEIWYTKGGEIRLTTTLRVCDVGYNFYSVREQLKDAKRYEDMMDMLGIRYQVNTDD